MAHDLAGHRAGSAAAARWWAPRRPPASRRDRNSLIHVHVHAPHRLDPFRRGGTAAQDGQGDPERIAELYAPDADWRLDRPEEERGRADTPWIRHRSTRADAAAHFRELAAHHVPEKADTRIERILVDAGDAVVLGEIRQTAAPTGRSCTARLALHLPSVTAC